MSKISRRKFLGLSALAAAGVGTPLALSGRLRVRNLRLSAHPKSRFIHFSDWHYSDDSSLAAEVVATINKLRPDFVCFTGDLVEDKRFLGDALNFIRQIKAPIYGVPGNHDYGCGAPFSEFEPAFAATGGGWLTNRSVFLPQNNLELIGMDRNGFPEIKSGPDSRRLLLMHYPVIADSLGDRQYDLILAGHSHAGQVRIPFYGPVMLPSGVGQYDYGRFATRAGTLHVSAGIGMLSSLPLRFNCPPEVTVVAI